jgi:hypothetical protein
MKRQIVIYKVKPEADAENQRLLEKVFEELHEKQPPDFRYLLARMEDGTFVHLVFSESDGPLPLNQMDSFKAYQEKVRERLIAPPQTGLATVIGDYRMLRS